MTSKLQILIETVETAKFLNEKINALCSIITYCGQISNYEIGMNYLLIAEEILASQENTNENFDLFTSIGNFYTKIGEYSKSILYHHRAEVISIKSGNKLGLSQSLYNLGIVYYYLGDYTTALEQVLESIRLIEEDLKIPPNPLYLNALGEIYRQMGNPELALVNLFRALNMFTNDETHRRVKGLCLQNIGSTYLRCKDFDNSLKYYLKAVDLYENEGLLEAEAHALALNNLGALYGTFEQYPQAIEYLLKALVIHEQIGGLNKDVICNTLSNLAEAYLKYGSPELSLHYLTTALSMAEIMDAKHRLFEIHDGFYSVYKSIGDFAKALNHHELYVNYKEQVYTKESAEKLQKMAILHQVESLKKEHEIEHQKNEQLNSANQKLKELNDEKDGFLEIASHDLKNPLTGMLYIANAMISGSCTADETIEFGGMLRFSAQGMFDLITNLLDSNRFENGSIEPSLTSIDSAQLVRHLAKNYKQNATSKKINVHCKTPANSFVLGDMQLLRQAVDNLLSNAIKYSPIDSDIYIEVVDKSIENSVVEIRVKDNGPGISEADKKKLFGKFQRLSAKPTAGEHSSGLGLSICKKLVEMMNGSVYCESTLGEGATFVIELPSTVEEKIEL